MLMQRCSNSLLLTVVEFDVFATLTFRGQEPSFDGAIRRGLLWLDCVRVMQRLPVADHYWVLRPERGEAGGRVHLHALLRVVPRSRGKFITPAGTVCVAHKLWGLGMTTFRHVEGREDSAILYLQKQLRDSDGADRYEYLKTAGNCYLIPSPALLKRAGLQESEESQVAAGSRPEAHWHPNGCAGLRDHETTDSRY